MEGIIVDQLTKDILITLYIPYRLTLKAPIMTAADDNSCDIFPNFRKK